MTMETLVSAPTTASGHPASEHPGAGVNTRPLVGVDGPLLIITLLLIGIGAVMMTSASVGVAEERFASSLFYAKRHLIYLTIAGVCGLVVFMVPLRAWQALGWPLLFAGLGLLAVVLVPGIGREVNGSQRWISFAGLTLQTSELAKFCFVIYLAGYLLRRQDEVRAQWRGFIKPMVLLAAYCYLLYMEPDFGALVVLSTTCLGMMFLAGLGLLQLFVFAGGAVGLMVVMVVNVDYRMARLHAYLDPWQEPTGSSYQLVQSLIAIGRGEWTGVGLGQSVQKLFYLPEAHTDFVFAILAEELGLLGVTAVIALFGALIGRCFWIGWRAQQARRPFGAYIVYGFALVIALQTLINMGVNCGLLPTKGLTLPFFSYGGSSLMVCVSMIALALRVDYELRISEWQEGERESS